MARIRTIKPEFWTDEDMSETSPEASLLAIGLLNYADDEGYFNAHPKLVEASIFPLRELSVSVHALLTELSNIKYITFFSGENGVFRQQNALSKVKGVKTYGLINNFLKHQKINRANPSKIRENISLTESSVSPHAQLSELSLTEEEEEREEEREREEEQGVTDYSASVPARENENIEKSVSQSVDLNRDSFEILLSNFTTKFPQSKKSKLGKAGDQCGVSDRLGLALKAKPLATWLKVFELAAKSDFLAGRVNGSRGVFNMQIAWILDVAHADDVLDGKYTTFERKKSPMNGAPMRNGFEKQDFGKTGDAMWG